MWDQPLVIVALATFVVGGVGTAGGLAWRFSRVEKAIIEQIVRTKEEIEEKLADERRQFDLVLDRTRRDFGETAAALRTKIQEVELFTRDTFMRRDSFYEVARQQQIENKSAWDRIEKRLERMELKIDSKPGTATVLPGGS